MDFIIVGYRCPSQTSPQSDDFLSDFEKLFDDVHIFQPAFTVFLGDFNARSKSWWSGHSTAVEGTRLDSFFSSWFTSTDIWTNSYIAELAVLHLIFTDQPSLVVDSGVCIWWWQFSSYATWKLSPSDNIANLILRL